MNTEALAKSAVGARWIRVVAAAMESRLRYRFFSPEKILANSPLRAGQVVLEVGCGTGFFSIPAARLIGDRGRLVAIDILSESVELVAQKARAAGMLNIETVPCDVLDPPLESGSSDAVILYGVIPAPMLPLVPLLAEMHRVLKPAGALTVWPPVPGWLPRSVLRSGLFGQAERRKGVHNFVRSDRPLACAGPDPSADDREVTQRLRGPEKDGPP